MRHPSFTISKELSGLSSDELDRMRNFVNPDPLLFEMSDKYIKSADLDPAVLAKLQARGVHPFLFTEQEGRFYFHAYLLDENGNYWGSKTEQPAPAGMVEGPKIHIPAGTESSNIHSFTVSYRDSQPSESEDQATE
jgi:hypothetical protein